MKNFTNTRQGHTISHYTELMGASSRSIPGFTLIELLVVVLIIGILAAVALPQYQKAVIKSRLAAIQPVIAAIKSSQESYFLTHGNYAFDLDALDITVPCNILTHDDGTTLNCDNYFVIDVLSAAQGNYQDSSHANIQAHYCADARIYKYVHNCQTHSDFTYTVWLDRSARPGQIQCSSRTDLGAAICNAI